MSGRLDNFRATFQDRMEGLILLCMGGFMAGLALSRQYWNFLNPKFSPLTLGAGCVICVCGLALLLRPEPGRGTVGRLLRQAAVLAFLCLAATAWEHTARELPPDASFTGPRGLSAPAEPGAAGVNGASEPVGPQAPEPPRVTRDGVEYVRLNLAELYIMLDRGRKDYPANFVLRANLTRPSWLGGGTLVSRIAVVCCLADSLNLGFQAQGLDKIRDGKWVEIYGHLAPLDAAGRKKSKSAQPDERELSLRVVNPAQRIVAEHVEVIPTPDPPFLFEFREKEPFAGQ